MQVSSEGFCLGGGAGRQVLEGGGRGGGVWDFGYQKWPDQISPTAHFVCSHDGHLVGGGGGGVRGVTSSFGVWPFYYFPGGGGGVLHFSQTLRWTRGGLRQWKSILQPPPLAQQLTPSSPWVPSFDTQEVPPDRARSSQVLGKRRAAAKGHPYNSRRVSSWEVLWPHRTGPCCLRRPLFGGVVAPRAHRGCTAATVSGPTPVHHPPPKQPIGGVFAQRGHSANYYGDYPGNNPENHPPCGIMHN